MTSVKQVFILTAWWLAVGVLIFGCDNSTQPPPPPPYRTLEIGLYNSPPEVEPGRNVYLTARVNDQNGVAQQGIRIFFEVTPQDIGQITPWAWTEPDSATGLRERVVFTGSRTGVALITGSCSIGENDTAIDTVHVQVREPING